MPTKAEMVTILAEQRPDLFADVDMDKLTDEEFKALVAEAFAPKVEMIHGFVDQPIDIDLDGLVKDAGLMYSDHVQRIQKRPDGSEGPVWVRTERPMTGADVLSWKVDGDTVIIVTKDGQKLHFTGPQQVVNLLD